MGDKLLLLDLDGTCRRPKANPDGFINDPLDQEIIPAAAMLLKMYAGAGWDCVGVTNQGGIALGHKTLGQAVDEQRQTLTLALDLQRIIFCPAAPGDPGEMCYELDGMDHVRTHLAEAGTHGGFRKPGPGMLNLVIGDYATFRYEPNSLGRDDILMVGDRPEDEQAAAAAGVPFKWAIDWHEEALEGIM